jgi:hypothetical protein
MRRRQFIENGIAVTLASAVPLRVPQSNQEKTTMTRTTVRRIDAESIKVFYREAARQTPRSYFCSTASPHRPFNSAN